MQHAGSYDIDLVALSVVIAVFASYTALDLASRVPASEGWKRYGWLAAAAFVMGAAISGMHYSAMQGAIFAYMAPMTGMSVPDVNQLSLALGIAGITAAILCIGLIATVYDRQIRLRAENEAAALRQVFETSHLYQWLLSTEGILQYANKTALAGIKARLDDVGDKP